MVLGIHCRKATVIVSYNSRADIARCIESAWAHSGQLDLVVVVDNNSTDDSRDIIESLRLSGRGPLLAIYLDRNIGFGSANNVAFCFAKAEWYFLLNADAWLVSSSDEAAIGIASVDRRIAICGLPLVFPDGSPQTYAYPFSNWRKWLLQALGARQLVLSLSRFGFAYRLLRHFSLARKLVESSRRKKLPIDDIASLRQSADLSVVDADWVCGAAMLIKGDLIRESGGFDYKIFLYGEDEDLCIYATKHGYRVVTVNTVPVVHVFGWGRSQFNPHVAMLKYDSLSYFISKNIEGKFNQFMMRSILPVHVYGWTRSWNVLRKR